MDLSAIYSKTPKGLRARASLIGGLSSHLMKVLTHVDGTSKAENILLKFDKLTPQQLSVDLARLEQEGYIRLATVSTAPDDSWALTINFEPMVVEEFQSEEELEAVAQAQKVQQARQLEQQQVEQQARQEEERRLAAEKKEQKLREKEKAKAETKVKAQLEQEKQAQKAAKKEAEAEAKLKAQQEAERVEQQRVAEQAAKLAEEAQLKAELKAREAAEQAEAKAEAAAKEDARREIERISRESEEAQKKAEAEAKAKLDAEQAAQQEAERKAQAEAEQARIEQEAKALAEKAAQEAAAQEKIRQEIAEAEAAAKAKLDAEQAAQQEAELKAQAEAEQARIDAEAKALAEKAAQEAAAQEKIRQEIAAAEAAAKAKAEQDLKEQARLEIANVLRKAEEDRKKAAAQAKEQKLEAKRQAKAEQEAKLQAERKAKEEAKQKKLNAIAEEKANAEAAEIARKNALEETRKQAEAEKLAADATVKTEQDSQHKTHQNEDLIAQQASAALRASLAAEEQANLAAKEQARLEMERIGREADLVRQKAAVEQHVAEVRKDLPSIDMPNTDKPNSTLPVLDDFDAAEAAEEAAFYEEEEAEEAVEKIQRTIAITTGAKATSAITAGAITASATSEKATKQKQAAENIARVDIRNAAIAEAEAMASVHSKSQSFVSVKKIKQWLVSGSKAIFIYVPVLLLLLLALLHFVNLSSLIKPIEQLASESVGESVAIKKVHASLWPQPHLVLEQIKIGSGSSIAAIHVLPEAASLFESSKVVKSLVIEGLNIEQANFGQPLQWASNISKAKNLKVKQINVNNLTLAIRDLQLESFDGKVTLTDVGALSSIELVSSNNALSVTISPQGDDYAVVLQAANWALPFNQKVMFNALNAKAVASQNQINFYQVKGELYGGSMTGQANIQWPDGAIPWQGTGSFMLNNANAGQLLNTFGSAVIVDGKVALEGSFSSKAREASKLADATVLNANFDVRQGSIKGIELAGAVLSRGSRSLVGDSTNFDKLTGSLRVDQDQYQFGKLALLSSQFNAYGFINISANQTVTGRLSADLVAQSRRLKANFNVTGRGKDLKSH
jgi:hypothetical protein